MATYPFYLLHVFVIEWALQRISDIRLARLLAFVLTTFCALILNYFFESKRRA